MRAAIERRELLDQLKLDHEIWCEKLNYTLRRRRLQYGAKSVLIKTLFDTMIILGPKQRKNQELECIGHEICHDLFHADCFAYRDIHKLQISKEEQQAEMFSSLICLPDISQFETEDQLLMTSGFSESIVRLRIHFKNKYGW